jgi:hypothetical protein
MKHKATSKRTPGTPASPAAAQLPSREHLAYLSGPELKALFEKVTDQDASALAVVPLVISAASALGNQKVLAALREHASLPEGQRRALTLDLMARSGNVDDALVGRYLEQHYPDIGVRRTLVGLMHVRKSSFQRAGAPLSPEVVAQLRFELDGATREDLTTMARILVLIDDVSDFGLVLNGLRGNEGKRAHLIEHACAMLFLQADLKLFAPDRTRSESLAVRMLALLATGAVTHINRSNALLQVGFSFIYASRPDEVARVLKLVSPQHRQEAAVIGLEAHMASSVGDMPRSLALLERSVRHVLVHPPVAEPKGSKAFNTDVAEAVLRDVNDVLRQAGLQPFIMSGTLLGYLREGGIMKHDKDFDIGIIGWEHQYAAAEALIRSRRYRLDPTRLTGPNLFCIPVTHVLSNMSFDLFMYHDKGDHFLHGIDFLSGFTLHFRWHKFSLQEIAFLGQRFLAPDDTERNMAENYGPGWREPDPGYHVKLEAPAIANRASDVVNFLAHQELLDAIQKRRDPAYLNRLADICEHLLTPGFRPADDVIAKLRTLKWT